MNQIMTSPIPRSRESVAMPRRGMGIISDPPPLTMDKWAQPDANSFRVRGKTYKKDRKKVNAGSSIGRLIAVDVVQVAKNFFTGFCAHPKERMQLFLERDRQRIANGLPSDLPPFIFCVNVCLPGPPCYHGVFYYAIDDIMSMIDRHSPLRSRVVCLCALVSTATAGAAFSSGGGGTDFLQEEASDERFEGLHQSRTNRRPSLHLPNIACLR